MATPTIAVDELPEIVRGSQLQVLFANDGNQKFIIHPRTTTRRSAQDKWLLKQSLGTGCQGSVDLHAKVVAEPGRPSLRAVKSIRLPDVLSVARSRTYQRELEAIAKFSLARVGFHSVLPNLDREVNREQAPQQNIPEESTVAETVMKAI